MHCFYHLVFISFSPLTTFSHITIFSYELESAFYILVLVLGTTQNKSKCSLFVIEDTKLLRPVCVDFLKLWLDSRYLLVVVLWEGCLGKWAFPGLLFPKLEVGGEGHTFSGNFFQFCLSISIVF